jgi:hypothetical protein
MSAGSSQAPRRRKRTDRHEDRALSAPRVFVSYRRSDSIAHAGRLYDSLATILPEDHIFMDVDTIGPGQDFAQVIDDAVARSDVLLLVIGMHWSDATDLRGQRRLDDANDVTRQEVETALRRAVRLVPVLVQGAPMPNPSELPPSLRDLTRYNAVELSDLHWRSDFSRLVGALDRALGRDLANSTRPASATTAQASEEDKRRYQMGTIVLGLLFVLDLFLPWVYWCDHHLLGLTFHFSGCTGGSGWSGLTKVSGAIVLALIVWELLPRRRLDQLTSAKVKLALAVAALGIAVVQTRLDGVVSSPSIWVWVGIGLVAAVTAVAFGRWRDAEILAHA